MAAKTPMLSVGPTYSSLAAVTPDPSSLQYGLQDISASDAGRTNDADATMYKLRVAQKRKLMLAWAMPSAEEAGAILRAFNPEYFYVRYFDLLDGRWETRQFYCGDRSAPYKWFGLPGKGTNVSSLSFDIVER